MAARTRPSERQRRLGAELRKLRRRAGLSGDAAGVLLDADRTRISHIEAGRMDVPRNGLYRLLRSYGCPEGPFFDGLMEMAHDRGKGWWDEYGEILGRSLLDLAELEARATGIRMHEPVFIPGMLQTPDYAHAVISTLEEDRENVDRYVRFRLARQRVLERETAGAVPYHAIVHESALRVRVGSARTMRRQLLKLIETARLPQVTLQVFPFAAGAHPAFAGPFVLFGGASPELDTAYVDTFGSPVFIGDGGRLAEYGRMFRRLSALALAPVDPETAPESHESRDSLSLIQHLMYEL
ncbi:helix-turn-helix domain-containing protein [Streptomyces zingiberis]|uniref:Helix-turn-helix domain-containing protein n=1 Tax=Streptomyces zingiberis TaxID=2053010 RepID=A0ABX1BWS9_9ACTN|nr:helix-turn-helix transcriptional regulator [Streptomyces zingiberis]NJQ00868.1 helix-turn-helix domain-containing protein [Streptomyces zingiberis]